VKIADKGGKLVKRFGGWKDEGHGWERAAIKRAFRSLLQRLQCSIGNFLPRINHKQPNAH